EIAANLSHPHILPLFDSDEADGFLYYVMPYVEGESLRERLGREGTLSVTEAIRITDQTAAALTYAHERGIVHRDIKPENILLAGDQAVVADFGIARAVQVAGGERLTGTGLAIGTPAYMSPEQAFGTGEVDATTDVYALGCVVHEMLTGRTPFEGATPLALLAQHAVDTVPSLRTHHPDIPVQVERAVQRALSKEPAARFPAATDLADALTDAMTPEASIAEERRVARRRWTRGLAAAGAVAVFALSGWWLTGQATAQPIEHLAVLPASNMTRNPEQDYFVDGVHEALVSELQRAGLSIIARQSVLQYRDTDKPIRQIAEELGVDALIQLTVGREGDSVIVDVSLYDGQSQLPLWTGSFPAEVQGVLGLYRDITRRIAGEVGVVLSTQAETQLAEQRTVNPQVYDAVLKGEFHFARQNPQDLAIALRYFESALAIDSLYAPAHHGIARVWGARSPGLISPEQAKPLIDQHLDRALELDPQYAKAHATKAADLFWRDWQLEAGEAAFRRALELDPNDAGTQVLFGHLLAILGRSQEAVRHAELAMELDPLNPFIVGLYGTLLLGLGRTDEAIDILEDMIERHPGAEFGVLVLINTLHAAGRHEEEHELRRTFYSSRGDQALVEALDRGLREGGHTAALKEAADLLAGRARDSYVHALLVAQLYTAAGDADKGVDWLEIAVEQRDPNITSVGIIPGFWKLHEHPRFRKLVQEIGVPLRKPAGQ
ncbi:MAG TPA: protein kinase, partial [Gemmatimonadaceae bacterium]|nr:protein kinase [Gemmatimonadaceae bacterium]